ncbi:hypothetical protein HWV62_8749 [Athelia sp. TMB]|nr:hypothetical protein HWV62_8749 [Athelia sp. TMB]
MISSTLAYTPGTCRDLRASLGGYPDLAALPTGSTSRGRLTAQVDAADRAFLRHDMHRDATHLAGGQGDHPLLLAFKQQNPGKPGERMLKEFLTLLRQDLYDVATTMDRLSGGATLILQTGETPTKIVNIAENNFAKVYFTPKWMDHLSTSAHEPLSNMVSTFINNIQVPLVSHQRAQLGSDNATEYVQGYAHIPNNLIPINMVVSGHPSSPWRGRPLGTATRPSPFVATVSRSKDVIEIPDSDDSDDAAVQSTPSRSSRGVDKIATKMMALYVDTSDEELDLQGHGLSTVPAASSLAVAPATAAHSVTPAPASRASAATLAELKNTPYTCFTPIIPPGPATERWLLDNKWPPRFANVLREVAEELSLGSWVNVLMEKHNVDHKSAKAMVKCLLEDKTLNHPLRTTMVLVHGSALTARARARKQQPQPRKKAVKLSAQARKELTAEQRIKRAAFDKDVTEIWNYCQKACADLGVKHKKPLRRCLDTVYLGAKATSKAHTKTNPWRAYVAAKVKEINADRQPGEAKVNALTISRTHGEEYRNTSTATIQHYIKELEESKVDKQMGRRVTIKSKVMDIHHTFEGIKTTSLIISQLLNKPFIKITNLDARVGIRAIVILVRSTSDYNQDPLSYFSDAATADFLPKVYGVDIQDLLTRFEGYSVAGGTLAGMATTYKERVQAAKTELSTKLRQGLRLITGKPKMKMVYKDFFRAITLEYNVVLRNWPHREFKSPGSMGSSLPAVLKLLELMTNGDVYFEVVDEDELKELKEEEDARIASGEVVVVVRKRRKDAGTGQQGYGRGGHESGSGSEADRPPAKKAKASAASGSKKPAHKSAPMVIDSD